MLKEKISKQKPRRQKLLEHLILECRLWIVEWNNMFCMVKQRVSVEDGCLESVLDKKGNNMEYRSCEMEWRPTYIKK